MALREDEDVAEAMGINLVKTKLLAFGIGAAFSGLAGAIFAARIGSIFPHSFDLLISINVLSLIIVGGIGSLPGVVVGAIALVGLPGVGKSLLFNRLRGWHISLSRPRLGEQDLARFLRRVHPRPDHLPEEQRVVGRIRDVHLIEPPPRI